MVAGATGEVGRGAAYALAKEGAAITLVGRSSAKLQAIQETLPDTTLSSRMIVADYSTPEGTQELAKQVADDKFDIVVASSGPWWNVQSLATADPETLHKAVAANFQSQLNLYSILATKCTGQYLMINGSAANGLPHSGLTGVLARACVGASMVMHHECSQSNTLPDYTHVLVSSSVGHAQFRSETLDPNDFGNVFVAMALKKHAVDEQGTTYVDDAYYKELVAKLAE